VRALPLLLVLLAGAALAAAPAHAQFDVTPLGCTVRTAPDVAFGVFGYENPNPRSVDVELGNENLVLQPPNYRPGQPTSFAPGFHEFAWNVTVAMADERQDRATWFLQGAAVTAGQTGAGCVGPAAPALALAPSIAPAGGEREYTIDPGVWTGGGNGLRFETRLESCTATGCEPFQPDVPQPLTTAPVTFTAPAALAGRRLRAHVHAVSPRGAALGVTGLTDPVAGDVTPAAPVPRTTSTVPRVALIGATAVVPGWHRTWGGAPAPELAYAWERCAPGGGACVALPTRTAWHRLTGDDVGRELQVTTTARNQAGEESVTTRRRLIDRTVSPAPPVLLRTPELATDRPAVGLPLVADPGAWTTADAPEVRWQRCVPGGCTDLPGAAGASYTPEPADAGARLRAVVSAGSDGPSRDGAPLVTRAWTATSGPVVAPSSTGAPVVAGSGDLGGPLTLTGTGTWSAPPASLTTTWERCAGAGACTPIPGASGATYVPVEADAGATVRAVVRAVTADGVAEAPSNAIGPVGAVRPGRAPAVDGLPRVGEELAADRGGWTGAGVVLRVQWLRCDPAGAACEELPRATGEAYRPGDADAGRTLRIRVTGANGFSSASALSAATAPVEPRPGAAPVAPVVVAPAVVVPSAGSGPSVALADRTAPVLSAVGATRRAFPVALGATAFDARARRGTVLRFTLSEAAHVRIDVRRRGRRGAPLGTLTRTLGAGAARVPFTGRLGRRALPPGRYVASLRATDAAGNRSRPAAVSLRILR